MENNQEKSKAELRESYPLLLWASSVAALLVIMLTVVAFYFVQVEHEAQDVQVRSQIIAKLTDSLFQELKPEQSQQKNIRSPLDRLRALTADDGPSNIVAEKIYRMATDNVYRGDGKRQLLNNLENLHGLTIRVAAQENLKVQEERSRLQVAMIVLTCLIIIVISFFTGLALGELKHRYKIYRKESELNKMKSHFISMASHEFRTPLSSIQLCVSLIEKYAAKADSENILRQGKKIRSTIANLTSILEDFLSLEKLETGKITPSYQFFDLPALCTDIIEEIRVISLSHQQLLYKPEGIKEMVNLDKNLVRNAIVNLLSNAVKYSGETAQITLNTNITETNIVIRVTDNGNGIPLNSQKNLFTPFFRADPNTSIPGTGLGLSIVKRYAELMKGTISFASIPNNSTWFELNFPVKP